MSSAAAAASSAQSAPRKKKIIIDTDAGGDDIVGILTAAADPNVEIVALCCVWGNVNVEQGIKNLGVIADAISASVTGYDIPLYIGADRPLLGGERETTQWYGFGEDGAGDAGFALSPRVDWAKRRPHAALALVEILDRIKEDDPAVWQVYAIGPLTNLAIALNLKPDLFRRLGDPATGDPGLIIMGGAMYGKGNASLTSEFNFACDPEAARCVMQNRSLRMPAMIISWELTVDASIPWHLFDMLLGRNPRVKRATSALTRTSSRSGIFTSTDSIGGSSGGAAGSNGQLWLDELDRCERSERIAAFMGAVMKKFEAVSRPKEVDLGEEERTQDTCVICDAVAIAVGLNAQQIVKERTRSYATVELAGSLTRGALCTSWYGSEKSLSAKGQWINADVVTKIDLDRMLVSIARIAHLGKEKRS
jgi:purine nucleosidase